MTEPSTALAVAPRGALARSELRPMPQRVRYPSKEEFGFITDMAKVYAEDDMFKALDMKAGAITAVALKGYELGVPFMAAIDGIRIIKGRPTLSASLMEALAEQRVPGARLEWVETGEGGVATCVAHRAGRPAIRLSFSWDDAKRAGLTQKDTYQKHPADLLRAGVMRKICKLQYAEVYFGFDLDADIGVETADGVEFVETVGEAVEPPAPPPTPVVVETPSAVLVPSPTAGLEPEAPAVARAATAPVAPAAQPTPAPTSTSAASTGPANEPENRILPFTNGPHIGKHLSDLNEKEIRQVANGFRSSLDKAKVDKNDQRIENYTKWLDLLMRWADHRGVKIAAPTAAAGG